MSKNAAPAVVAYLAQHGLSDLGLAAPAATEPGQAALVGDSSTDIEAARAAGVLVIA